MVITAAAAPHLSSSWHGYQQWPTDPLILNLISRQVANSRYLWQHIRNNFISCCAFWIQIDFVFLLPLCFKNNQPISFAGIYRNFSEGQEGIWPDYLNSFFFFNFSGLFGFSYWMPPFWSELPDGSSLDLTIYSKFQLTDHKLPNNNHFIPPVVSANILIPLLNSNTFDPFYVCFYNINVYHNDQIGWN